MLYVSSRIQRRWCSGGRGGLLWSIVVLFSCAFETRMTAGDMRGEIPVPPRFFDAGSACAAACRRRPRLSNQFRVVACFLRPGRLSTRVDVCTQARQAALHAAQEKASLEEKLAEKDLHLGLLQEELRHQPAPTQHLDAPAPLPHRNALQAAGGGPGGGSGDAGGGSGALFAGTAGGVGTRAKPETLLDTAELLQRQVSVRPCRVCFISCLPSPPCPYTMRRSASLLLILRELAARVFQTQARYRLAISRTYRRSWSAGKSGRRWGR